MHVNGAPPMMQPPNIGVVPGPGPVPAPGPAGPPGSDRKNQLLFHNKQMCFASSIKFGHYRLFNVISSELT